MTIFQEKNPLITIVQHISNRVGGVGNSHGDNNSQSWGNYWTLLFLLAIAFPRIETAKTSLQRLIILNPFLILSSRAKLIS